MLPATWQFQIERDRVGDILVVRLTGRLAEASGGRWTVVEKILEPGEPLPQWPVDGTFTPVQRDLYELVLAAQTACIDAVTPGAPFHDYHRVAERVLAQGFIDLGLCSGTLDGVLESGSFRQFYMHRAGHWLGMDVHDAGVYQRAGESVRLVPGMVLTVEPGAYIRSADNVPESFWNIGVRIEDDVLVGADGVENLTAATPKSIADVEAACA